MTDQSLPASLAREGELMARAVARDLADVPGVEIVISRDSRLTQAPAASDVVVIEPGREVWSTWRAIMARVDAVWPIAPETDGVLERLSRLAVEQGAALLGTRPDTVALAASKRATAQRLADHGVPVVPTWRIADAPLSEAKRWVVKPDDGVGCVGARVYSADDLRAAVAAGTVPAACVAQPWIDGVPASLSLLCRRGKAWLLCANVQRLRMRDDALELAGVRVNGFADAGATLARIGAQVAAALPGLWGYVGVDLVLHGSQPLVLEVNPRVTTSYAGLRAALGINPAALILALPHRAPDLSAAAARARVEVDVETGDAA